ncbi:phage antirepressor N-terminal domain-containing protein [[Clostridium] innocuum]|nr:phage antirepressor N-terminal domain-containing protein [[Clostridium] innocuum]MCR0474235.1 phage antirepressor N-terminal domain-containing protein [[Clostridium] innocuum]
MAELEIKKVDFYDSELIGVQEAATGKVFTAINNVLKGIGFDDRQIEHQRNKWKEDEAVSKGVQKFSYPSEGGTQEAYCIDIIKLPLALAKINITPKIKKENPRLAEMLELYQDKCAEVLAKSFFRKQTDFIKSYSTKATSVGELANLMKEWGRALRDANGDPEKIVELYEKLNRQLGMDIPSDLLGKKKKKNQQLAYALIPMDFE